MAPSPFPDVPPSIASTPAGSGAALEPARWLLPLLWAVGLVTGLLYLAWGPSEPRWFSVATKPFPVLCMAIWTGVTQRDRFGRCITLGLLFAMAGDIALIWPGNRAFLAGLVLNLVAHLWYIGGFSSDVRAAKPLRALVTLGGVGGLYLFLYPGLGGMTVPVALYTLAIGSMMWRAAARVGDPGSSRFSQWAGVLGATGFALCDSLIALNRFHAPIANVHLAIMVSYWLGQLGISRSARRTP